MTTRTRAAAAASFLAIGIIVGAAGPIVARDATSTDHMRDMAGMTSMMGASGMAGMTSMMGASGMAGMTSMMGGSPMGGSPMGPNASMTPGDHGAHHATPSPRATR